MSDASLPPVTPAPPNKDPEHLTDAELLAVVAFGSRNKRAAGHARRVLGQNSFATFYRVHRLHGLDSNAMVKVEAAMELARRSINPDRGEKMASPSTVATYLIANYGHLPHEVFGLVYLDIHNHIISHEALFSGGIAGAVVSVNEIVRRCISRNAKHVILFHNHPSGNPAPSKDDQELTAQLAATLALIDVTVIDHIIVGDTAFSFLENHLMS